MSIFGKMFRRGGPRDPGDGDGEGPGQGQGQGVEHTPAEPAHHERLNPFEDDPSLRPTQEPEETTLPSYPPTDVREMVADEPPDDEQPPGSASSPVTGATPRPASAPLAAPASAAAASARLQSFSLPPGVVAQPPRPRRQSQQQPGNGRAGGRKPPSPTGPHGPSPAELQAQQQAAPRPSRPAAPQQAAPQAPAAPSPSRPNTAPSALGSAPPIAMPPLRTGAAAPLPRASTQQRPAAPPPRGAPPRNSAVITSAEPPAAQPPAAQPPAAQPHPHQHQPSMRARRVSPLHPEATPPAAAAPSPSTISESVSREIELRGRPKPSTVEIADILDDLDNATGRALGSHAAELEIELTPATSVEVPQPAGAAARRDRAPTEREPEMASGDREALHELFNELAGHHLAQLRDLMIEVRLGSALSEWIELSEPAVRSVRGMAEQLEMSDLCVALDKLLGELSGTRQKGGAISGARRDALLAAYAPLQALVPGALEVDKERDRREPVIVHSLLRQVDGVEKVAIDKLVAANLVSISALSTARSDELAAVTGLSRELAERLIARFRDYRAQSGVVASPDPMAELRFLGVLCASLRQQNRDYDDAGAQWSEDAKERKRELRRQRAETLLRIHVSLARLGQVDQLVELDKLSFRRKADYVETYLKAARATRAKTMLPGPPI